MMGGAAFSPEERRENGRPAPEELSFSLPPELEAGEPPEARGLGRDQVRLMVSRVGNGEILHTDFARIVDFLDPGDALVINTSGTLKASLAAERPDGALLEVRLSNRLPAELWVLELRRRGANGAEPFLHARAGEALRLPGGGLARLLVAYEPQQRSPASSGDSPIHRWLASLELPAPLPEYLERYGSPIRYAYIRQEWPIEYYQNVYATEPGSAEMPSAGRAFTPELITRLVARGVLIAPLLLHAGISSLQAGEQPAEEFYRVPAESARAVNAGRAAGKRAVAVGTSVVRALETVAGPNGALSPGEGWTGLVLTPERGLRAVDALLTGLHEPKASHLDLLAALAGYDHLRLAYQQALARRYRWHEFGDLHLILP